MKVLTIESPQRLKDRTVKAVITVKDEDYIPLIMISDRIYKGEEGDIDIRSEDTPQEDTPISLILEAMKPIIQSQLNIAEQMGYQRGKESQMTMKGRLLTKEITEPKGE